MPNSQLAIDPLAPKTTQKTPKIAATAAIQALTSVKLPLSTKDAIERASIEQSRLTSNQLSDLKVSLSNAVYRFLNIGVFQNNK